MAPVPVPGPGLDHQVLAVKSGADVQDLEPATLQQRRQGPRGEIGDVLVVDVPERDLAEDSGRVGHLEEDDRVPPPADGAAHHAHEFIRLPDMFQGHLARIEISLRLRMGLREDLGDDRHPPARQPVATVHIGRIEAYAAVVAHGAEKRQELPLAAAELDDPLVAQVVAVNQARREVLVETVEGR